jgi:hypothetical protein
MIKIQGKLINKISQADDSHLKQKILYFLASLTARRSGSQSRLHTYRVEESNHR